MKEINESKLGVNPFIKSLTIVTSINRTGHYTIDDVDGGKMLNEITYGREKQHLIKVYISSDNRITLGKLKLAGSHLLHWLHQTVDYAKDYVFIDRERASKELNISLVTLKTGIESLIDNNILSNTRVQSVYFINPTFFFKGDRIKKYPDRLITYKVTQYTLNKDNNEVIEDATEIVTLNNN